MNKIKAKILKQKTVVKEEGVIVLRRLTQHGFLSKFWLFDVQAVLSPFYYQRLFLR
jgi:hypothetical protein